MLFHFKLIFQIAVLQGFIQLNITPSIIQKGNTILSMDIASLKIRFLNSSSYLKGSTFEIASQYRIPLCSMYFPASWNVEEFYNYSGTKPNQTDFFCFVDSDEVRSDKKYYWKNLPNNWVMKEELVRTLRNETLIFTKSLLCFLQQCFELQDAIAESIKKKPSAIHPFGHNITSLSGFSYSVFCFYYMNDTQIFSVMKPYTSLPTRISRGEYEYTSWLDWKFYEEKIETAFNCPSGQACFGKHYVDAYSPVSKTITQYRGCEFHCHVPCLAKKNKDRTMESTNFLNIPMAELLKKDQVVRFKELFLSILNK